MLTNTYISSPGVVNTSPTDTTVYLLSSINDVGKELIIRDAAPLTTGTVIVSTTSGLYFSPSLSTVQLSSFTLTSPYDYITVASRTPQEYMLLQSVQLPTRADNQALAPNFLQLSTLTALSITAGSNAELRNLTIAGSIETAPGATTTASFPTIHATAYASTAQLVASSIRTSYMTAADYTAPTLNTLYSAYGANVSTAADFTVTLDASFNANFLQYGDLKTTNPTTVAGTAYFVSTLTADNNTLIYGPAVGFGSNVGVAGALTAATTLSTLTTWSGDGPFYTSNYTAVGSAGHISTTDTTITGHLSTSKLYVGPTSNTTPYSAYIDGHTYASQMLISPAISTTTYSTLGISLSSINFITPAQSARLKADDTFLYLNEAIITDIEYTYTSTVTSSNWVSTSYMKSSNIQVNQPFLGVNVPMSNTPRALDIRGNMFVSTALIANNLAIYGGSDPNLYTNPSYNTIYMSSSGMLLNNRLFIDNTTNRVGVNTTNPQYTLDVSGLIYQTASIAYNTGSSTWIIPSDDTLKENVADISATPYVEIFENVKLKKYKYADTTYTVDISQAVYDEAGNITGYTNAVQTYKKGFATDYGLGTTAHYGFLAQDIEFYFPNSVVERPFYGYDDFKFINYDSILNVNYAMTHMMLSTSKGHSTIIGHRDELISTFTNTQANILTELRNIPPYNGINVINGKWILPA